ncbi:putative methyltransferase [Spironucleus salmonicida]|uniref:Methyltransferase n=1 Tax=Spironucleus salmonicida TaxID=348837 RepID=A0A9P8LNW4_9EUKA|nr:putative methyltransferase [Spironucleus salmonicida]KAH0571615.1 putative methyltransferase [Spironucleus salmonicida]
MKNLPLLAQTALEAAVSYYYVQNKLVFSDIKYLNIIISTIQQDAAVDSMLTQQIVNACFSNKSKQRNLAIFALNQLYHKTQIIVSDQIISAIALIDTQIPTFQPIHKIFTENQLLRDNAIINSEKILELNQKLQPITFSTQQQTKIDVEPKKFSLIPVCSLLDNSVNLGGICRTSEIFGAEKMIIGDLKLCEHSVFRGSAVTADQHIVIEEWRVEELQEKLKSLKEAGYCVIALEQCSGSVSLDQFKFPSKCAIVLGNETTGCPDKILQMCDHFVEIPQFGVVRSLNVHVSFSLLCWEYVKQWM